VSASPRLAAYVAFGAAGLVLGLLLGRPEPVVLAAPFVLTAALALATLRSPAVEAELVLDRARAVEGEDVVATLTLRSDAPVHGARVDLRTAGGLRVLNTPAEMVASVRPGATAQLQVRIRCRRWGGYSVGDLRVRSADRFGLFRFDHRFERRPQNPLKVYPGGEEVRASLKALDTQVFAGNQVSRLKGEGIEFADVRAFVPGDIVRRVNWRVSARRGELHTNEMHLERNADVVIFLDTFSELRDSGTSTLDLAVRGAAALVNRHLAQRDRVGLVSFGGTLRWLRPAMGEVQLYRLVDSLIDTEVHLSFAWKGLEVIPRRVLPPKSLVIAFSPLLDERSVAALADLRARGHDVTVIEVSAESFLRPGPAETDRIAFRLWQMERDAMRARFRQLGVPIAAWPREGSLQDALEEVRAFRRYARVVRV
jgi:uncharacterized protein (DUF58 family)